MSVSPSSVCAGDASPTCPPGVVELREDVPLKGGDGGGGGGGDGWGAPRGVLACFSVLTVGITVALLGQLYAGGAGAVPHGSVAAGGGAVCSRAGTDTLRAGGGALDAAAAAALCLALAAPQRTGLDASGALVYWDYRTSREKPPLLASWGAAAAGSSAAAAGSSAPASGGEERAMPRLVCALARLHAGVDAEGMPAARLAWADWLQPALYFINTGHRTPDTSAERDAFTLTSPPPRPAPPPPRLAAYMLTLQNYTSAELVSRCGAVGAVNVTAARGGRAGRWQVWSAPGAADALVRALRAQDLPLPPLDTQLDPLDRAIYRAAVSLSAADAVAGAGGVASGVAAVDSRDAYLALVTGLSAAAAARAAGVDEPAAAAAGWQRDEPAAPLDLAPAIIAEELVCGTRFVVGAESRAALSQAGAALAAGAGPGALPLPGVERARLAAAPGGLAGEARLGAAPPPALSALAAGRTPLAAAAAVNVVQQRGDELASHADSRGGGVASRF